MNKQEAAEFLGVSVRAVERYTQQGKLSVKYEPGKTRPVAAYNEAELTVLKEELQRQLYHQRPQVIATNSANPEQDGKQLVSLSGFPDTLQLIAASVRESVAASLESMQRSDHLPINLSQLNCKLTLSLQEAAALSGLSRSFLLDAIHNKKLKAAKRGRGWNIKRIDLDAYVKKL